MGSSYLTMASEAWSAYRYYQAAPEQFQAWVAEKFYLMAKQSNKPRTYEDCRLMAEGFIMGIKYSVSGEMQFKLAWQNYEQEIQGNPAFL